MVLVGGCPDRVGVAGSGSGSGHRDCNAAPHHLVNTVFCLLERTVLPWATTLTEGNNKTGTKKKKRTYILGLCYACTVGAWGWSTDYPILLKVQADD